MKQIPMFKVGMSPDVNHDLLSVIHSGWIGQGQKVVEFEKELSLVFSNDKVLSLSSGTHGLSLALRLAGVGVGDEVITTPLTCTATNMPILQAGADIVWADVKEDFNIDPESIEDLITEKTKAIIVVHWGGYPCDMKKIYAIVRKHIGLKIIEDCAHAYGSSYLGHPMGDCYYSDYAMFSFQAIKHLTTVDGGALCCKFERDYKRGKLLRWYGIDREGIQDQISDVRMI
jgi:perosamine synthetase